MSGGDTGGAVPGATMTAVRRRWRATAIGKGRDAPTQGDTQWLVAEALAAWDRIDAQAAALAEAERALAALLDIPPEEDSNGYRLCGYCAGSGDVLGDPPEHQPWCPVVLGRAALRWLDAPRAATATEEDADGADAGDTGTRAGR